MSILFRFTKRRIIFLIIVAMSICLSLRASAWEKPYAKLTIYAFGDAGAKAASGNQGHTWLTITNTSGKTITFLDYEIKPGQKHTQATNHKSRLASEQYSCKYHNSRNRLNLWYKSKKAPRSHSERYKNDNACKIGGCRSSFFEAYHTGYQSRQYDSGTYQIVVITI